MTKVLRSPTLMRVFLFPAIFLVAIIATTNCTTYQMTVKINRPLQAVSDAVEKSDQKLGYKDGIFSMPSLLLTPLALSEVNSNWTTFNFPSYSVYPGNSVWITKRAIFQELGKGEGLKIPANPPYLQEKNVFAPLGLFFVNLGLTYNYIYENNIYTGREMFESMKPLIITLGVLDAGCVGAITVGLIGSILKPRDLTWMITALVGLGGWASARGSIAVSSLVNSLDVIDYHNRLVKSGYNWDPAYNTEDNNDLKWNITIMEMKY